MGLQEIAIKVALENNTDVFEEKTLEDYGYQSYSSLWEDIQSGKFSVDGFCLNCDAFVDATDLSLEAVVSSIIDDISRAFFEMKKQSK